MPSLFFSLCLPTFKRNHSRFVPIPPLSPLRESASSIFLCLSLFQPSLSAPSPHKLLFFFFFVWIFHFFLFRIFIFLIVLQRRLQLVEHCDDIRIVFLVMVDLLLRAFFGQTVHVLRNLLHLFSFFSTFRRSSRFRLGCLGLTDPM